MTDDLPKRLRDMGCSFCNDLLEEAADEIERLRAALDKIANGKRDIDLSYLDLFVELKLEARAALKIKDADQ